MATGLRALFIGFGLAYLVAALTNQSGMLMLLVAFPSVYVIPGTFLVLFLRRGGASARQVLVEGFFLSLLVSVLLTSLFLALGLPLSPLEYSVAMLFFPLCFFFVRSPRISGGLDRGLMIYFVGVLLVYVFAALWLASVPRFFTNDELSYILSARMGAAGYLIPAFRATPGTGSLGVLLQGSYLWLTLLSSFIGSTGTPPAGAGLASLGFLTLTALASSMLVEEKWQQAVTIVLVGSNALLLSFSGLALSDLAVAFLTVFSVVYFLRAVTQKGSLGEVDFGALFFSFAGLVLILLIKPNILVVVPMWLVLLYLTVKYRRSDRSLRYRLLLVAVLLPVCYELLADVPFFLSVWIFHNAGLESFFRPLLVFGVSPALTLAEAFKSPSFLPTNPTLFTRGLTTNLEYFYTLVSPETYTIVIPGLVLASPFLMMSRSARGTPKRTILGVLVLISTFLLLLIGPAFSSVAEFPRYSLWLIPLWIPFALLILHDLKEHPSIWKFVPVVAAMYLVMSANSYLSNTVGLYLGYSSVAPSSTISILAIEFISSIFFLSLLLFAGYRRNSTRSTLRRSQLMKIGTAIILLLILANSAFFTSNFIANSPWYQQHGFSSISENVISASSPSTLLISNEFLYLSPYIPVNTITSGHSFPSPDSNSSFANLVAASPSGSLIAIGNDPDATIYYGNAEVDGNSYIESYFNDSTIQPQTGNQNATTFAHLLANLAPTPYGVVNLFKVQDTSRSQLSPVIVKSSSAALDQNLDVIIMLNLEEYSSSQATVVLATPFFSEVYPVFLTAGLNNVTLSIERGSAANPQYDWTHSAQLWVMILQDGVVAYSTTLSLTNTGLTNILFLLLVGSLLVTVAASMYYEKDRLLQWATP